MNTPRDATAAVPIHALPDPNLGGRRGHARRAAALVLLAIWAGPAACGGGSSAHDGAGGRSGGSSSGAASSLAGSAGDTGASDSGPSSIDGGTSPGSTSNDSVGCGTPDSVSGDDAGAPPDSGEDAAASPDPCNDANAPADSSEDAGAPADSGNESSASSGSSASLDGAVEADSGSSGGAGDCGATPIDPNATAPARALLCYLYAIYGRQVLSGQQETSWSNPQGDIDYYVTITGKHPAILGGDYLYPNGTTSRAIAYWNAGGLTMMRYHMGAPPLADTYENAKGAVADFDALTQAGTDENVSLDSKLDYLAGELTKLQNANAAVILVLYHEVDRGAWFWWSRGTGPQFVNLWKYTVDYVTHKGVHNVLWTLGFGHDGAMADYYPGKAYVDIGGIDEYDSSGEPFAPYYAGTKAVFGATMPIPLHETGTIPQPADMFPGAAPWLLWNVWAGYENTTLSGVAYNTPATIQQAYADPHTITRELLPGVR